MGESKNEKVTDIMKDFHTSLTSTGALLVTISTAITPFVSSRAGFPTQFIFYSAIAYLISVITGIIAHGALTSAVYYGSDPFTSKWVRVPAMAQWVAFVLGSGIAVYMLYILTV